MMRAKLLQRPDRVSFEFERNGQKLVLSTGDVKKLDLEFDVTPEALAELTKFGIPFALMKADA